MVIIMDKKILYNIDSDKKDEQWMHRKPKKNSVDNAKRILGIK